MITAFCKKDGSRRGFLLNQEKNEIQSILRILGLDNACHISNQLHTWKDYVDMFPKVAATIWYQSFPAKPTLITEQHEFGSSTELGMMAAYNFIYRSCIRLVLWWMIWKGNSMHIQKEFMRVTPFELTPTTPRKLSSHLHDSSSWLITLNGISDRAISAASQINSSQDCSNKEQTEVDKEKDGFWRV